MRAEHAAHMLGTLDPNERAQLVELLRDGALLDAPDGDSSDDSPPPDAPRPGARPRRLARRRRGALEPGVPVATHRRCEDDEAWTLGPEGLAAVKLTEIVERQEAIRAELDTIEKNPASVEETDGDYTDTLIAEFDTLEERRVPLADRAQKLNLIAAGAKDETATEPGESREVGLTAFARTRKDPFADMDQVRTGMLRDSEMKGRAQDAIEWISRSPYTEFPDAHAERATQLASSSKGIAKHILQTGSPDYYEAFRSYMQDPEGMGHLRGTSLATGSLGFMLPFVLDPTIILTNAGSANPYRRGQPGGADDVEHVERRHLGWCQRSVRR